MTKVMWKVFYRALSTSLPCIKAVIPSNLKGKDISSADWLKQLLSDPYVEKARMLNYRALCTSLPCCKSVIPSSLKGKGVSSQDWLRRQLSDPYVEKAHMLNYRCRSAFKLIEMDNRFRFLNPGQVVIDCGAAPGSWTQVAVQRVDATATGAVIAVDKQQIYPIPGATVLGNTDFTLPASQDKIKDLLSGRKADVVMSDMAPSATGIRDMDVENIVHLCYMVLRFAVLVSNVDATLIVKLWQSGQTKKLEEDMVRFYKHVRVVKPEASRSDSAEIFLLARQFKGLKIN